MNKKTLAMALMVAITSGTAFANEPTGDFVDELVINGTGAAIASESGIPGFDKYFGSDEPAVRAQGALEFARAAAENPQLIDVANTIATKVGGEDKAWGAGDHLLADLKGAVSGTPNNAHQRAMRDEMVKAGATKEDFDAAKDAMKDYTPTSRTEDWKGAAEGNVKIINDEIDRQDQQREENSRRSEENRQGIDKNKSEIGRIDRENQNRDVKSDANEKRSIDNDKRSRANEDRSINNETKSEYNRQNIEKNKDAIKGNSDRIDENGKRIDDTNKRVDDANRRIDDNGRKVDENKDNIDANKRAIEDVDRRGNSERNRIEKKVDKNTKDINDRLDKENKEAQDEYKRVQAEVDHDVKAADSEYKEFQGAVSKKMATVDSQVTANSDKIEENSARIDSLRDDLQRQGEEMRERYDGVKASTHAAMSARAFTSEPGEFAVGAGIGAAGSKRALAIGGAYQFNENWSGNFIGSYETAGKYTKSDLAVGVGAQYTFK